jgi:hypothetical protein
MDLHRQVALREEENSDTSWEFGSPVSFEEPGIVGGWGFVWWWGWWAGRQAVRESMGIKGWAGTVYEEADGRETWKKAQKP